jgi:hypothetical protein
VCMGVFGIFGDLGGLPLRPLLGCKNFKIAVGRISTEYTELDLFILLNPYIHWALA